MENRVAGDSVDYVVDCNINVKKGLVIKPGVRIVFNADRGLIISESAKFLAQGTEVAPIVFTGKEAVKGYWKGITIWSANILNEISYAEVSYAGSSELTGVKVLTGIGVVYDCKLSLKNTIISNSKGFGLVVIDDAELTGFSNNSFLANGEAPLKLPANQVHMLDPASKIHQWKW